VKRLENVPFKDFLNSDLFVRILSAERSGLITVTIDVNDSLEETLELYQSKSYGATAAAWNKQRRLVLNEALHKHLYPMLKLECRHRLEKEAFEVVAQSQHVSRSSRRPRDDHLCARSA
jgi:transcription elongation factor SPT6